MRVVSFLVLLASLGASAQEAPTSAAPAPTARLFVTGGAALRQLSQPFEGEGVTIRGFAPTTLHASGAYFFSSWFGLDLEGRGEVFYASNATTTSGKVPLGGFGLAALPAFRWSPLSWLDAEAHLGWSVQGRPVISLATPTAPTGGLTVVTGPAAGLAVSFEPSPWLSAQLFARAEIPLGTAVGFGGALGAQLRLGSLDFGDTRWGIGLTYEGAALHAGSGQATLWHVEHRFGLGIAMLTRHPAPLLPPPPGATLATLRGHVLVTGSNAPVPGAVVEVGAQAATTDAQGRFMLSELPPGGASVRVTAKGFKVATQDVTLSVAAPTDVDFRLDPPTGPGHITGLVKDADGKPLAGALVRADGGAGAKTGPDGAFVLEKVGPGPVTVTAALNGFEKGEEVVQVPPEATAQVTFALKATGVRVKATLKGLVVGADGAVPKATVRVVELKLNLKVKADGRFEAEVPGGHYTVTIQAPGYVTQSKTIEVADGDQAIFHAELEKAR